jgi:GNAT superfamily N-acetyltransferase
VTPRFAWAPVAFGVHDAAMSEMADRLHEALLDAFELVVGLLPDAQMERRDGYVVVSAPSFPVHLANAVWAAGPHEGPAIRDLASAVADIEARGPDPAVVVIEGLSAAVEDEARRLGLERLEEIPGMVASPATFQPAADPGPELVRVGGDNELLRVALDVTARGFEGPPEPFEAYFATAAASEPVDLWLAYEGGEAVSTATGVRTGDALGVFNVATPPEHRRRGYGAWTTAHVVRRGFEAGASFTYLQSSGMGFAVYERLGFEQVSTYRLLTRPGSG